MLALLIPFYSSTAGGVYGQRSQDPLCGRVFIFLDGQREE